MSKGLTAFGEALPVLDESRCTGCGDCVAVCPTHCLALRGALVWMPRPGDCLSCAACVVVCPTRALQLPTTSRTESELDR